MIQQSLRYGKTTLQASFPEKRVLQIIQGKKTDPVNHIRSGVQAALRQPIGRPPLKNLLQNGDKVSVIVSDITRAWIHYEKFLPCLLDELNEYGIPDRDITLVVALGAHRRHTPEEHLHAYGKEAVRRVNIVESYAREEADFVYVGTTSRGTRAYLNRQVVEADKVILTGGIAYHSMAGFGGGRKGIVPGVSRYSTIQENHRFCLHPEVGQGISPTAESGRLAGNPMHEDLMEIAAFLDPAFLLNVITTADGNFARFIGGHWNEAWLEGCRVIADLYGVPLKEKADLVIASAGGYPKDANLYQGTKAVDNALMAVKDDGVIILLLECVDIGEPPDFSGWFKYVDLQERERHLREDFTVPGFVALKCGYDLRRVPQVLVTLPENREFAVKAGFLPAATLEEALALAENILKKPDYTVILMPDGGNTVPVLA